MQTMAHHKGKLVVFVLLFMMLGGFLDARRLRNTPNRSDDSKGSNDSGTPVTLSINKQYAVMDNGIVQVKLSIPGGDVVGIQYGGIANLLAPGQKENSRGYWDVFWTTEQTNNGEDWLHMENFRVIMQNDNQVELSFSTPWNGDSNAIPVNIDKRYVMLRGSSGFYNYVTLDHQENFPATNISQIRAAFKLHQDKFHYMVISDDIQKIMPRAQDVQSGQHLAYGEAILWTNQTNSLTTTAVEDKYQYSQDMKDQQVHGWISSDDDTSVGFWLVKPTTEFYPAGPFKQELTSHLGPTSLVDFFGGHYGGQTLEMELQNGESWQKVIGPYFVYLNKASGVGDPYAQLWSNAKKQLQEETNKWPYEFLSSELYAKPDQRGLIGGQLFVRDGQMSELVTASSAWVGLAAPGEAGAWQRETKRYQFWTQADEAGNFAIKGVLEGEYSLYAWVPGFIGEYVHNTNIIVHQGDKTNLGEIIYEPPRNGQTLWEIGTPDRTAAEFFVPDPRPEFINQAFLNSNNNKFRQYGLWDRYTDLYPNQDLVYTIGVSNQKNDWFYAHVPRRISSDEFEQTTWQIKFQLRELNLLATYTLRLALASANSAQVQVRFNNFNTWPLFRTGHIGFDNAIARHGIHGLFWMFNVDVPGSMLQYGTNTLYLTQAVAGNPFCGVMYDYIRLEGPSS